VPNVGDVQTPHLQVTPAGDGTTTATLVVRNPSLVVVAHTPAPTTSDGGTNWTAPPLTFSTAGIWRLTWTVTGTGAGQVTDKVPVGPAGITSAGRAYATSGDLADYLQDAPPDNADRLLVRATDIIDRLLLAARYRLDDDGNAADADVIEALKKATCAQVAWWIETGDEWGLGANYQSVSIGSVSLSRGQSGGGAASARVGPDVWAALAQAGLTGYGPALRGWF
jgi:hypothetical protein